MRIFIQCQSIFFHKQLNKLMRQQCEISEYVLFPCPRVNPSFYKPLSVHHLRPGDIKVIATLGDFLASGTGSQAEDINNAGTQYRGSSFLSGVDGNWRNTLTIANMLRIYNSDLYGGSQGKGSSSSLRSGLNFAEKSATSRTLLKQAEKLVDTLKNSEYENEWKIVNILIGQNDLCQLVCDRGNNETKFESAFEFSENIEDVLDFLQQKLPRTFVNLIQPLNPSYFMEALNRPIVCHLATKMFCPCVDGKKALSKQEMQKKVEIFRKKLTYLAQLDKYQEDDYFTISLQPGLLSMEIPKMEEKFLGQPLPDLSYLAPNCLYPSQKLHALMAKSIWNNLYQKDNLKTDFNPEDSLNCPTPNRPYLITKQNSNEIFIQTDRIDNQDIILAKKNLRKIPIKTKRYENYDNCQIL